MTTLPDTLLDQPDSAQLTNGNIIVTSEDGYSNHGIQYLIFDGSTYEPLAQMTPIPDQEESEVSNYVSVSKGPKGTAILTWQSQPEVSDDWDMVYALIDADGTVKTPPITFKSFSYSESSLYNEISSINGQGNTTLYYEYDPYFTSTPRTGAILNTTYTYHVRTDDWNLPDDSLAITCDLKPDWLTCTDNGDGTATLTGTPDTEGSFPVEITVEDENYNEKTQSFNIEVTDAILYIFPIFFR